MRRSGVLHNSWRAVPQQPRTEQNLLLRAPTPCGAETHCGVATRYGVETPCGAETRSGVEMPCGAEAHPLEKTRNCLVGRQVDQLINLPVNYTILIGKKAQKKVEVKVTALQSSGLL